MILSQLDEIISTLDDAIRLELTSHGLHNVEDADLLHLMSRERLIHSEDLLEALI